MKSNKFIPGINPPLITPSALFPVVGIGVSAGDSHTFEKLNSTIISLNEQLVEERNFSDAIIANLCQPMLVLDMNFRVKKCSPAFLKFYSVNEDEIEGKLIYELGNKEWDIPALRTMLEKSLPEKSRFTNFEVTPTFSNIGIRTILLNAHEILKPNTTEKLILLSIEDITDQKKIQHKENELAIVPGITEQIISRKIIEESEINFRTLIEQAPVATCFFTGREMTIQVANDIMIGYWGKGKNVIGKTLAEAIPELKGQPFLQILEDVFTTGKTYAAKNECAQLELNGVSGTYYFDYTYKPIRNAAGEVYGIIDMAVDVTEQVLAQKKLEESEYTFREMIFSSPSLIAIIKGENFIIEIANDAILETWGKGKNVFGKPLLEVLPEIIEQGLYEILHKVFITGIPYRSNEMPVYLLRNNEMELSYYNVVYQAQRNLKGEIEGVAIIANEVTPQVKSNIKIKTSEEKFRLLVQQAPVAICVVRGENYIIEVINSGMVEIWDRKIEDVINRPAFDVLAELKEQGFKELLDQVSTTGKTFVAEEMPITFLRNDKLENCFIKFVYEPLREADGTISGVMVLAHEITEQVVARQKIEERETKFRTLIEDAPVATCFFTGREMTIEVANDTMLRVWGKDKNVIGKTLIKAVPELEGHPWLQILDEVFITGKTYEDKNAFAQLEVNGVLGNYYFDFTYKPIRNAAGEVYGIMDMAVDVTEQVMSKKALEESERNLRNTILNAPVAMCIYRGPTFVVKIANNRMLELWGKPAEAVINKPLFDGLPEVKNHGLEEIINKVYQTGETFSAPEFAVTLLRNGTLELVYVNFIYEAYREAEGAISGIITVAIDVTEQVLARKKVEVQNLLFQDMLMTAPGFVCTLKGPDHVYELVNPRYQSLFGKRTIQGLPIKEALPELEGQGFYELLDNVYNTGEVYLGIDVPIALGRDDTSVLETRYFNLSYQPMYNENNNIFSILVFGYEVTEQVIAKNNNFHSEQLRGKELELKVIQRTLELRKANGDLMNINKELAAFTYVSSHDLQEPLRKIQTFAARILEQEADNLSDKGKNMFDRMRDAAVRMQILIQDLLAFSRLTNTEKEFETTDLNKIVDQVKKDLVENINCKHAIIQTAGLCNAYIIPFQFRQLMQNLISNALKFSKPDKAPYIIINCSNIKCNEENDDKLQPGKEYCHITVTDNGIGFEIEYSEKIFEVFQRLHSREEYAGTGIGLAIVKKIVENHNGVITATSELGKGTRFDIYIPAL